MKRILALFFLFSAVAVAQDKPAKIYSEQGTVVAVHARRIAPGYIFGTGGDSGPSATLSSRASCRVETTSRFYEYSMRGKMPNCEIGQSIDFRVEGHSVYVAGQDGKEHKYRLVAIEQKTDQRP